VIHQKIGLQSGKRRLQSGGKSTYSNSKAANFRKPALSSGNSHKGAAIVHISQAGFAALEFHREQQAQRTMATACRHPKVRIVSRHDDTEYVECLECGEVFDSEEFRDMEIEDTAGTEDLQDDS
jgi:hypothetical protein